MMKKKKTSQVIVEYIVETYEWKKRKSSKINLLPFVAMEMFSKNLLPSRILQLPVSETSTHVGKHV